MHNSDIQSRPIFLLKQLGVAALYALLIFLDHRYFESGTAVSSFEAASGFALGVLLTGGRRYVWGVFFGAFLINATTNSWEGAVAISSGDALEAFCGAWLLTRNNKFDLAISSLRDYLRLTLVSGVIGIGIGANAGVAALVSFGLIAPGEFFRELAHWWTGDLLGVILITPLILVYRHTKNEWSGTKRIWEAALLLGLTFVAGQVIFLDWLHNRDGLIEGIAKGYWMFLFIFWVAVRLGTRGTVIAINVAAVQGLLGAYQETGFFAHDIAQTQLTNYWCYTIILSMVGMALATYFSELRLSNEMLHRSQTRLRTLYESTSDAVMMLDEKGFFDCNRATLAIFGCATKEEFCSKHPADLSPPVQSCGTDSTTLANRRIAVAMEHGSNYFEWMHQRTDTGQAFPADVLLNSMELDGRTVLQATVRDISARKQADEALLESEEMLRRAQGIARVGHFKFNPFTGVVDGSDELFRIFGLAREEFQFSDFVNTVHPDDRALDVATIESAIEQKTGYEIEHRLMLRDGTIKWVRAIGEFVSAAPEEQSLLIGTVQDITEHKSVETEILAMQIQLQATLDAIPDLLFEIDLDGRYHDARSSRRELLAAPAEVLVGKTVHEALSPEAADVVMLALREAHEKGSSFGRHIELQLPHGTFWFELSVARKHGIAAFMPHFIVLSRDITERKQAEATLRKLSLVVEQSPNSIVITDLDANIEFVNQAFIKETGYSFDEAVGQTPRLLNSGKNWKAVYDEMWACLHRGEAWKGELINRRKDGSEYIESALISPVRQADGHVTHYLAIKENITQRKNNELKIARLSRIYLLLSRVNESIVRTHDAKELFTAVCNAAIVSELFRFAWVGMLDEQRLAVIPSGYAGVEEGYMEKIKIYLDDERTGNGPIARAIRTDTPVVTQDIENDPSMAPWRDEAMKRGYRSSAAFPFHEADTVIGTINIYSAEANFFTPDIVQLMRELAADVSFALDVLTEKKRRKLAEDEVIQLNVELEHRVVERTRQLETANKELEAFSYSVSHDLRAPLRSIDGFSRVLSKKYHAQLDATGQDWLERVCRASQHMGCMIDDILQLSQVTRGPLKRRPVDLSAMAENVADDLRKTNPERQVRVILPQDMIIHADAGLMRIVMGNLLGNAWKYTGKKTEAEIEFGVRNINGGLVFFVRDNGAGFNMDYAHKLFGAFQRLHGEKEFEGTGIGLATVKRIIHRHNGKIWAEAIEGLGATFYFTLPQEERGGEPDEHEEAK